MMEEGTRRLSEDSFKFRHIVIKDFTPVPAGHSELLTLLIL